MAGRDLGKFEAKGKCRDVWGQSGFRVWGLGGLGFRDGYRGIWGVQALSKH